MKSYATFQASVETGMYKKRFSLNSLAVEIYVNIDLSFWKKKVNKAEQNGAQLTATGGQKLH